MDNNLYLYSRKKEHIIEVCPRKNEHWMQPPHKDLVGKTKLAGIEYPYLYVKLLLSGKPVLSTNTLVDSGADRLLIGQDFIYLCKIAP